MYVTRRCAILFLQNRVFLIALSASFNDGRVIHFIAVGVSSVVEIYNGAAKTWSLSFLSSSRFDIAATSLPDQGLAIFAGGSLTWTWTWHGTCHGTAQGDVYALFRVVYLEF